MKSKKVTFVISASLVRQGEKGKILIDGFFLMKCTKNWLGRERFQVLQKFKTSAEAVQALNKGLGL